MHPSSIAAYFLPEGSMPQCTAFGSGHINETYRVQTADGKRYILQKINQYVFKNPVAVMENCVAVTRFLSGKDPDPRHAVHFLPTHDGRYYHVDAQGEYWRMYDYLEGFCLDMPESYEDLYQSALAFGRFQTLLEDFPAHTLHETIPHFHDTPHRYAQLRASMDADPAGRLASCQDTVDRLLSHEDIASVLQRALENGQLPLRVTHNDTKLNNVLLDPKTREGLCLLDLDTVMPGLSLHDFGDAVRFGAATAPEDAPDASAMGLDLEAYRAYVRGYLESANMLTQQELQHIPVSPIVLTLETAVRFLKDHLDGDVYFHIAYPGHNLVRAKAQLALAENMIHNYDTMQKILEEERNQ